MMPRNIDAKKVSPDRARIYWDKARDFFRMMRDAAQAGNWNGTGLAAVHCAISATDALLVAKAGRRSASKAHDDAADLVLTYVRHPQTTEQARRLRGILNQKTMIEYVDKHFHAQSALELQKQVERYVAWVQSLLSI